MNDNLRRELKICDESNELLLTVWKINEFKFQFFPFSQ
jgi:hypothetical protein